MTTTNEGGHVARTIFDEHVCDAIVVSCIDFRFWEALFAFVRERLGIQRFDPLVLAGGGKNLSDPSQAGLSETVLFNIGVSERLHRIKKVVLTNHVDCGAYGGSTRFNGRGEEIAFHTAELEKAAGIIREKFPRLEVIKVFVSRSGDSADFMVLP